MGRVLDVIAVVPTWGVAFGHCAANVETGAHITHLSIGIRNSSPVATTVGKLFSFGVVIIYPCELRVGEIRELVLQKTIHGGYIIRILWSEDSTAIGVVTVLSLILTFGAVQNCTNPKMTGTLMNFPC